jgi:hypothetical protein
MPSYKAAPPIYKGKHLPPGTEVYCYGMCYYGVYENDGKVYPCGVDCPAMSSIRPSRSSASFFFYLLI